MDQNVDCAKLQNTLGQIETNVEKNSNFNNLPAQQVHPTSTLLNQVYTPSATAIPTSIAFGNENLNILNQ